MRRLIVQTTSSKVVIECPLAYSELKTKTFEKLWTEWKGDVSPKGLIQLFALVTDKHYSDFDVSADEALMDTLYKAVQFIITDNIDELPMPGVFVTRMGTVLIPKDLGRLTLAQNLHVHQLLAKGPRANLARITAIYLQPIIDGGPFDEDRVEVLAAEISDMPVSRVYPVASFFIKKHGSYGTMRTRLSLLIWRITPMLKGVVRWLKRQK